MKMGVIGFGGRISGIINIIRNMGLGAELVAIADINKEKVKKLLETKEIDSSKINFYENSDEMLEKETLDGVLIGTRCSLHTRMAVKVLKRNLPLFLEKPVATSMEDLLALKAAAEQSKAR